VRLRRVGARRKTATHVSNLTRRLGIWVILLIAAVSGVSLGLKQLKTAEWLRVNSIQIKGLVHYHESTVLARAQLEIGQNILNINPKTAEQALSLLPGVEGVNVTRKFPSILGIELKEKDAVAIGRDGAWAGLYDNGATLTGGSWQNVDLPIIENLNLLSRERRALIGGWLERVRTEKAEIYSRFSQIEPDKNGSMFIVLRDGEARLLVDPLCKSLNSLDFLKPLLRDRAATWKPGATVDLRVASHAYVH